MKQQFSRLLDNHRDGVASSEQRRVVYDAAKDDHFKRGFSLDGLDDYQNYINSFEFQPRLGSQKDQKHATPLSFDSFKEIEQSEPRDSGGFDMISSDDAFFRQNRWSTSRVVEY